MSFVATEGDKCKFVGTYKVRNKISLADAKQLFNIPDIGMPELYKDSSFYYDMQEVDYMSDFKDRFIINWGKNGLTWHLFSRKKIVEILPARIYKRIPWI
jgi:hypothetical protein